MEQQHKYMVRVSCMTYNHAPYIEDAMNGFCMQETTFPFVCTIVDDASTDGEQEVIKKYLDEHFDLNDDLVVRNEETDDYCLTFAQHKTNKNCYFAVLYLKYNHYSTKKPKKPYIKEWCETKYIAICEGDDYWIVPNKLQMQVEFMEGNTDYGLCHTNYTTTGRAHITPMRTEKDDNYWPSILTKGLRITTATAMIRTRIYNSLPHLYVGKGWPIGDLPMWYEIARISKIRYISKVTAKYRFLPESASHSNSLERVLNYEEKKLEMKRFYAKAYNVEVDEQVWKTQSYEIIIRFAARNKNIEVVEKYFAEAKKKNIVSYKMLLYYNATKFSIIDWLLRKTHLM